MKSHYSASDFRSRVFTLSTLLCLVCATTPAQSWRDELKAEESRNSARIAQIDAIAEPLAKLLRQNTAEISRHNAPGNQPANDNPSAVAAYNSEAARLNDTKQNLVSQLQPLVAEQDRLIQRNKEIEAKIRLSCVTLPIKCTGDSDCGPCGVCGSFDGNSRTGVCQPRP